MRATSKTWLPEPAPGTQICLGFDGSLTTDWTCVRAETLDGLLFTPRWGYGGMTWDPEKSGGRIPKSEVGEAVADVFARFDVFRMYADPPYWATELDEWAAKYGEERVIQWATYRPIPMHAALERFVTDLTSRKIRHDGCPVTTQHVGHARMLPRRDGRYGLGKPDESRKIDAAITAVLAHEAAADARAAGWGESKTQHFTFGL